MAKEAKKPKYDPSDERYMKRRFALEAALTNNRDSGRVSMQQLIVEAKQVEKFLDGDDK
jgi:hypothetical protein